MKIAEIEYTPNPNAVKFILSDSLTALGTTRTFNSDEEAEGVTLAQEILKLESVISVFIADRWLTVTQDGQTDWHDLLREIAKPIREAEVDEVRQQLGAHAAALATAGAGVENEGEGLDDPRMPLIREVLEDNIIPFLAGDGGGLEIKALVDNQLLIHYQGACGTCPSSVTGTLMAIEHMLQSEVDPDLEVMSI